MALIFVFFSNAMMVVKSGKELWMLDVLFPYFSGQNKENEQVFENASFELRNLLLVDNLRKTLH
jgi:hypothetical protein